MLQLNDIAIVILNWNGKTLLERFLPSVLKYSEGASIYVVDNASTDNSIAYVSENFPSVKRIINTKNEGYAKGYNTALKHLKEPILCLLNNDVEVTEHWLQPIINTYNTNANAAIIQPKILDYKNKSYFEYAGAAGGFIDKYGYPYCRGRIFNTIERDLGQYNDTCPILWASGACLFIKNSVFKELKGFDESFFAHMEEIDLCWRAYNNNYKTLYVSKSVIYHVGGATLHTTDAKKTYLNFRNSLFTLVKNTDSKPLIKALIRLKLDGIAALRFLLQLKPQHFIAIIKAHFSFYVHLNSILKQRKLLQKKHGYYKTQSIVWEYFVKKKTRF